MRFSIKTDPISLQFKKLLKNINKYSKKSHCLPLGLLVLLNIIIRLPMTSHEVGVDTYFIHTLSASMSTVGKAGWIIHPLSFFGLYPYSYASAQPFILSGISQSLGISLEDAILLLSIILGVLGSLSAFILGKEIFDKEVYGILTALLYSIAPNFVRFSYWQASTRSMFLAILPLIIWFLIRCGNKSKLRYVFLSLIVILFSLSTHRTAIFLIISIFTYIITFFTIQSLKNFRHLAPQNANIHGTYIILFLSFTLFISQFTNLGLVSLDDYYSGMLANGSDILSVALNMGADYIGKLGILLVFSLIGFLELSFRTPKNFAKYFVLLNVIFLLPVMGFEDYSPLILSPFLLILTVIGIKKILNFIDNNIKYKNVAVFSFVLICVVSSAIFMEFMADHWGIKKDTLSEETFNSASFIKERGSGTVIANGGGLASKVTAYSTVPAIPLGGEYVIYDPPCQIAYGFVDLDEIGTRPLNISEIRPNTDKFYSLTYAPNAKDEWVYIMQNNYWDIEKELSEYNASLVIETNHGQQYLYWKWRFSRLLTSLHDSGNKVYDNEVESIYSVP